MAKILLVEDNEMNRDMLSRRLERRGYEVVIAVDGGEGVALARSAAPDLILMDMSLPVIDGWEATRQLKASPEMKNVPIIALTAHAMSGDREKALNLREQAIQLNRLGVVIIAACRHGFLPIARHGMRRQGDHWDGPGFRLRLEPSRGFPAVQNWQAHVHQDQVGFAIGRCLQPFSTILGY